MRSANTVLNLKSDLNRGFSQRNIPSFSGKVFSGKDIERGKFRNHIVLFCGRRSHIEILLNCAAQMFGNIEECLGITAGYQFEMDTKNA